MNEYLIKYKVSKKSLFGGSENSVIIIKEKSAKKAIKKAVKELDERMKEFNIDYEMPMFEFCITDIKKIT